MPDHEVQETKEACLLRCAELKIQLAQRKKRLNRAATRLMDTAGAAVTTDPTDAHGALSQSIKELGITQIISDVKAAQRELFAAQSDAENFGQP